MKFNKITTVLLQVFFLFSCENGGEGLEVERTDSDYAPNTVGSQWTYHDLILDLNITNSAIDKVKEFDNKVYYVIKSQTPSFPDLGLSYHRKEGDSYYTRETLDNMYENGELLYLKDAPLASKWTQVVFPDTENENILQLEIIEVDGTYTLNELEFTNVIAVKATNITDLEEEDPTFTITYFAKGVGRIKSTNYDGTTIQEIVSFTIQ